MAAVDAVQPPCGSGDEFARRLVLQHQRAVLAQNREKRRVQVSGWRAADESGWQVSNLAQEPGGLHVRQRHRSQRLEDRARRRLHPYRDAIAKLSLLCQRFE